MSRIAALVAALVLGLFLAACSGSNDAASGKSAERFTRVNWDVLMSDPFSFEGARVEIVGRVFGIPERDAGNTYWQMYADPANNGWTTIVGYADPTFAVAADDYVEVTGTVKGGIEGQDISGTPFKSVAIIAESAKVVDAP